MQAVFFILVGSIGVLFFVWDQYRVFIIPGYFGNDNNFLLTRSIILQKTFK